MIVLRPRRPLRRAAGFVFILAFAGALPVLAQEPGSNQARTAGSAPADTIADRWPQDVRSRAAPRIAEPVPLPAVRQASQQQARPATPRTATQRKAHAKSARAARGHKANTRTPRAAAHRRARATVKAQQAKSATTARAKSASRVRVGKRRAGRPLALTPPVLRQAQRRS